MDSVRDDVTGVARATANLAAIKGVWGTLGTSGVEASMEELIAICHEHAELRPYAGGGRVLRGPEEIRAFLRETNAAGTRLQVRPRSYAVEGDSVVVGGSIRVTKADGSFAETQGRWVHRFDGDRIDAISWEPRTGGTAVPPKRRHVQAVVDSLNARDFDALHELPFTEDMEYRSAFAVAEGGTYRGVAGLRQWSADVDATWDHLRVELSEFHDVDDEHAVAIIRLTGIARASGVPLDVRVGQVWTWRGDKMLRSVVYTDPTEAFRTVGIEPS